MFSKDPTRSRASLLQRDGHEAASFFHRVERAVEQFRATLSNELSTASYRLASGLVPLSTPRRLREAPDRGPIGPPRVSSAPQIRQIFLQDHFVFLMRPSVVFPARLDAETPVEAVESFAQRLIAQALLRNRQERSMPHCGTLFLPASE
jgi:hypothetical protein